MWVTIQNELGWEYAIAPNVWKLKECKKIIEIKVNDLIVWSDPN